MNEIIKNLKNLIGQSAQTCFFNDKVDFHQIESLVGNESKVYDLWHEAPASEWAESVVYNSFLELFADYINLKGNIKTM